MGLKASLIGMFFFLICVLSVSINAQITVVMESYPPNSYYEDVPSVISQDNFKKEVIGKIKDPESVKFLNNSFRFDGKSRSYLLKVSSDPAFQEEVKRILVSSGFLHLTGLEVEITREVFNRMGIKPEYKVYPWARCIEMMRSGSADAIINIFKTPEREQFLYYPAVCNIMEENALFKLNGNPVTFDGNLEKLKNHWIAVKCSTSYGRQFDESKDLKKHEVSYTPDVIRLVENKRVELGIGPVRGITFFAKKMDNLNKFTFLKPFVCNDPLYTAFSKKKNNIKFVEEFSKQLKAFKNTVKYREILSRYGV